MLLQKDIIIEQSKQLGNISFQIRTETQALKRLQQKVDHYEKEQTSLERRKIFPFNGITRVQKRLKKMKRLLNRKREAVDSKVQTYCQKMQQMSPVAKPPKVIPAIKSLFRWLTTTQ